MKIHSVAVLGAGAVGSYVIWGLSEKKDISLSVIAKGERAERLKAEGCLINGKTYHPECVQMCTFNLLFNKQRNHRHIKLYRIQICTSFAWAGLPIIKPHFLLRIYKHKFVFIKCILNLIRKLSLHKPFQAAYGHCVGIFLHIPDKTFHCKVRILINNTYSSEASFSHCKPDNCRV